MGEWYHLAMDEPLQIAMDASGVVLGKFSGDLSGERVERMRATTVLSIDLMHAAYAKAGNKPLRVLLDLTGFTGVYTVEAVKVLTDFAAANKEIVGKTAGFGGPDKVTAAGEMIAALASRENMQFFHTREEAMAWLDR
jgi:hypothetical protein